MSRSPTPPNGEVDVLMLVSARVDAKLRAEVAEGGRPCPEYLRLEQRHGVTLLDWSALPGDGGQRSVVRSLVHVAKAVPRLRRVDVVFSDGEHIGIPLAVVMSALRVKTPHLMIGHHLSTRGKRMVLRCLRPYRRLDRVIVHSPNQLALVARDIPPLASHLAVVPYGIDTDFWSPHPVSELVAEADTDTGNLVVSAGREHRDYRTLVGACPDRVHVFIADDSPHSPNAQRLEPETWPAHVERRSLGRLELRQMYARASVVVVPVIDTPFPFGITTLLEAMSMGQAVVVAGSEGLQGIVDDGHTGIVVPPADVAALRRAIEDLVAHPDKRRELGRNARQAALDRFSLDVYGDELARHLAELRGRSPSRDAR